MEDVILNGVHVISKCILTVMYFNAKLSASLLAIFCSYCHFLLLGPKYLLQNPVLGHTQYTGCPTRYRTRHFFNNSNTNEDIAPKFEQGYVRCVRNEEECVCSVCL
jgi:hypothetical protein